MPSLPGEFQDATLTSPPAPVAGDGLPVAEQGRYDLRRELGRGGQSIVYLAVDSAMGREVALKQLREPLDPGGRFIREAKITGQLEHPGIVPVYEIGRDERGALYCTQKLVRGRSLRTALDSVHALVDRLALLSHFVDVCNAVAYAHSRGVVHRDLKPENVMVGEFGETVVLDWGVARVLGSEDESGPVRPVADSLGPSGTQVGSVIGTPLYMSPEQAAGGVEKVGPASDVWGLGVMLYELLAGKPPFEALTVAHLLLKVREGRYVPLSVAAPGVPRELSAIVEHALRVSPVERISDARQLASELEAFRSGGRVSVYEYSSLELFRRFVKRNPALTRVVAASGVLLTLAALVASGLLAVNVINLRKSFHERASSAEAEFDWTKAVELYGKAERIGSTPRSLWGQALLAPLVPATGPSWHPRLGAPVLRAAFDASGERLVMRHDEDGIRLFAGEDDPSEAWPLPSIQARAMSLALSPDGRAVAWGTPAGLRVAGQDLVVEGAPDSAALAFSSDGATLAIGRRDGSVELHEAATGALRSTLEGPLAAMTCLAFSRDGTQLAAANALGELAIWDTVRGVRLKTLAGQQKAYTVVTFSPDGRKVVVGNEVGQVDVFGLEGERLEHTLSRHRRAIAALRFSRDGRTLATAGTDDSVVLWDARDFNPLGRLSCLQPKALWLSDDAARLRCLDYSGRTVSWDVSGLAASRRIVDDAPGPGPQIVGGLAFSGDGARLTWMTPTRLHSIELGKGLDAGVSVPNALRLGPMPGFNLVPAPGGALIAAPDEGRVTLLSAVDLTRREQLRISGWGNVNGLAFSVPDQRLYVASDEGVDGWDFEHRAKLWTEPAKRVAGVAVSSEGSRVAWWLESEQVVLFDPRARRVISTHFGPGVRGLVFSPGGAVLVEFGDRLKFYDAATGELLRDCHGSHTAAITSAAFQPSARTLATGSLDRSVRLWTVPECVEAGQLPALDHEVTRVAWSPLDGLIAAGDLTGVVTLFSFHPPE
ncbi:MAG: serine/threonine-protein kinase [Archangium sp.]|nr:serine/threonine-protein kinase [Archangium sp.]